MDTNVTPIKPIITNYKGKTIKRYNARYAKSNGNDPKKVNIGVTPQGSFYYRETLPDKSWSFLYMQKYDGTEVLVDSVQMNGYKKGTVEVRQSHPNTKSKIVTGGKTINHYDNGYNDVIERDIKGNKSGAYIQDEVFIALNKLKKRVDVSDLKPIKRNRLQKVLRKFFK